MSGLFEVLLLQLDAINIIIAVSNNLFNNLIRIFESYSSKRKGPLILNFIDTKIYQENFISNYMDGNFHYKDNESLIKFTTNVYKSSI